MAKKIVKSTNVKKAVTISKKVQKPSIDPKVLIKKVNDEQEKQKEMPDLASDGKLNLDTFTVDQIIAWRNIASQRVDNRDKEIDNWAKAGQNILKLQNKNHRDLTWISRLNRHLNRRVFKYSTKPITN